MNLPRCSQDDFLYLSQVHAQMSLSDWDWLIPPRTLVSYILTRIFLKPITLVFPPPQWLEPHSNKTHTYFFIMFIVHFSVNQEVRPLQQGILCFHFIVFPKPPAIFRVWLWTSIPWIMIKTDNWTPKHQAHSSARNKMGARPTTCARAPSAILQLFPSMHLHIPMERRLLLLRHSTVLHFYTDWFTNSYWMMICTFPLWLLVSLWPNGCLCKIQIYFYCSSP